MTYKLSLDQVKEKLVESKKIDAATLDSKIKAKINELSGLVSEEGAAHIIANELGVNVLPEVQDTKMNIRDLAPGMNGVQMLVKVAQIWEMREFSKNDYTGKVQSMLVADESGKTRFTLWNDQVDHFKGSKEGDVLLIKGVYVKENNGRVEVHLGKGGTFEVNPEGKTVEIKVGGAFERKELGSLTGGEEGVEVMGTIVQVFDPRFFNVHPETGRRIREGEEGDVTPALSYVMNAILDDGTSNIRCVFWKAQVNMLLNNDEAKMHEYQQDLSLFEDEKTDLLGEQFVVRGNVKHNEMFDRLEFSVRTVSKADPAVEISKLDAASSKGAKEEVAAKETVEVKAEEKVQETVKETVVESAVEPVVAEEAVSSEVSTPVPALEAMESVETVEAAEVVATEKVESLDDLPAVEEEMIQ